MLPWQRKILAKLQKYVVYVKMLSSHKAFAYAKPYSRTDE
jgi:hypothetical protein